MSLLWIGLKARWFFFLDFWKTVWRYYRNLSFAKIDLYLIGSYLFRNPYRISRRFLKEKGEKEIYAYGETPLTTLEHICLECGITNKDMVYELGCGRGRTCFWLNAWLGCRVVGVDYIPEFVTRSRSIVHNCHLKGIEFRLEDIGNTKFDDASVVYLFGTCLDDETIHKIIANLSLAKPGLKIISVSYPLTDYDKEGILKVEHQFQGSFAWGKSDVYLQILK